MQTKCTTIIVDAFLDIFGTAKRTLYKETNFIMIKSMFAYCMAVFGVVQIASSKWILPKTQNRCQINHPCPLSTVMRNNNGDVMAKVNGVIVLLSISLSISIYVNVLQDTWMLIVDNTPNGRLLRRCQLTR
jgi:hypothetical protein